MVKRILQRSSDALTSQQHTILSAATVIGLIYGLSAILGFVRIRLLSSAFGDSSTLGVYFAADVIPSLMLSLIVSGSLSATFVPVFTKYYRKSKKEAWHFTSGLFNVSLFILFLFTISIMIFPKFITGSVIARDSSLTPEDIALMANLMRVMMLAQLVLIFSSLFTSVLQSFKRFLIPAFGPVMYNLGIIIFIILFVNKWGVYAPAWGMVFGAILHAGIQFIVVRRMGFSYSLNFDIKHEGVKEVYKLTLPRATGQAVQRLLLPLNTNLALFISGASNVILTFATDIQSLPIRIFGVSIGQAALPILSNAYEDGDIDEFKRLLIKTVKQVIFFLMPISILLFVLRVPLVRLTVGARKYPWLATVMTAYSLGFFSISIVSQSLNIILARAFYALYNTKTPVKISLFSISVNAILAIVSVRFLGLGVWSLSLAYAIGSILNSILLFISIVKHLGGIDHLKFIKSINRIGFASILTGITLYIPLKTMDALIFDTTRTIGLIVLTGIVSIIGFVAYILYSRLLAVEQLSMFWSSINVTHKRFLSKFSNGG